MLKLGLLLFLYTNSLFLSAETIIGTDDDDILVESINQDRLVGGPGADEFQIFLDYKEVDTIADFTPDQGDFITLTFSDNSLQKSVQNLPRGLGSEDFHVDKNGFLRVYLSDNNSRTLLNLKKPQIILKVEESENEIRLYFRSRF